MLSKRTEAAARETGTGGGGWGDVIFGGGSDAKARGGRPRQGMGEMVGRELQRSIARTLASTIKSIIVKSITGRSR
jgi:hypothetical protein